MTQTQEIARWYITEAYDALRKADEVYRLAQEDDEYRDKIKAIGAIREEVLELVDIDQD
jgi:hypothetical protein